jgi:hypothetical protein
LLLLLTLALSLALDFPVAFGVDDLMFFQILDFFPAQMDKPADRTGEIHIIVSGTLFEFVGGHMPDIAAGTVRRFDPDDLSLLYFVILVHKEDPE